MLTPFLGIDSNGKPKIYVSPFALSLLSPMHLRGFPIPKKVEQLIDGDEDCALDALKLMQKYFNDFDTSKKKKK